MGALGTFGAKRRAFPLWLRSARVAKREARVERSLVWMLGSPRSGSTWLLNMLACHPRLVAVDEPGIGLHLGALTHQVMSAPAASVDPDERLVTRLRADAPDYFFSRRYESAWGPQLRTLILERFGAQLETAEHQAAGRLPIAIVKEPNGSQAAEMIFSLLPRSMLIFLLRDGRDVIDSQLDSARTGGWVTRYGGAGETTREDRLSFIRERAYEWLWRTEAVQSAYAGLPDERRITVRYERLLDDTTGELGRIIGWLGIEALPGQVATAVNRLSFDAIPAEERGAGKFARAATPGLWREGLSLEEQQLVEDIIGPKLTELEYRQAR